MVTLLSTTAICFNPRPSCEGRLIPKTIANQIIKFQSTPLMRGATRVTSPPAGTDGFQSTPLMRGATDGRLVEPHALVVSIHAPHARGDLALLDRRGARAVSIHAPHARGDVPKGDRETFDSKFQSTPLMRGATCEVKAKERAEEVSIHAPHARGDISQLVVIPVMYVSIHAPHARGDQDICACGGS